MTLAQQVPGDIAAWLIGTPVTVLAAITWMWITGRIHSDKAMQQVIKRCELADAKNQELEEELRRIAREDRTTLVPLLTRTADTLTKYLDRKENTPPPPTKGGR